MNTDTFIEMYGDSEETIHLFTQNFLTTYEQNIFNISQLIGSPAVQYSLDEETGHGTTSIEFTTGDALLSIVFFMVQNEDPILPGVAYLRTHLSVANNSVVLSRRAIDIVEDLTKPNIFGLMGA